MARKVLNRKELRAANDAAEAAEEVEVDDDADTEGDDEEGSKPKAKKPAKKAAKRKSRAKTAKEVRLKAFWGVFNQSLKRVAVFDYSDKKSADKKAQDMTASGKTPHFVQLVKEAIEE